MHPVELIGYLASALVFATFCVKAMTPLRLIAIASNIAFIGYGYLGQMAPILLLHVGLLPLNVWRLCQTQRSNKVSAHHQGGLPVRDVPARSQDVATPRWRAHLLRPATPHGPSRQALGVYAASRRRTLKAPPLKATRMPNLLRFRLVLRQHVV
jgi:hypothetical protein